MKSILTSQMIIIKNVQSKSKKLCGDKDCETCFSLSFASHPKAKYWSDVNDTTPEFVSKNAHDNYFFNCCHLFESSTY